MFNENEERELEQDLNNKETSNEEEVQINVTKKRKRFDDFKIKYKKNKKKYLVTLSAILAMLSMTMGSSYAYLTYVSQTDNTVTINAGTLALIFQNEENVISILNAVPMKDQAGLEQEEEYSFDVKNNGSIPAIYKITLDNTCESGNGLDLCIPDEYIKVGIKVGNNDYKVVERNDKSTYIIETGSLQPNKSQNYKMKLWLAHSTPNTYNAQNNQSIAYKGKLGLTYEQGKTVPSYVDTMKKLANTNQTINFRQAPSDTNGNGINILEGTENDAHPIYFYRGFDTEGKHVVSNNNVLFGGFCWKIVRTTDTGGIKIVYNGTQKKEYDSIEKLNQSAYTSVSNDAAYPYEFDTTNKTWTSTNHTDSKTGTITFKLSEAGDYIFNYNVSSETNYDKAKIYKDNTLLETLSGTQEGTIDLTGITTNTVIKVEYTKDSGSSSGNDNVIFSIGKPIGKTKLSCNNTGTATQLSAKSAFNSNRNSPAYNGYMYGTVYSYKSGATSGSLFGSSFTYSNGSYTLSNTTSAADNTHHYTCNNTTGTCSTIRYYYNISGSSNYYIELTNGKSVSDALEEMQTNTTDSTIKTVIDNWYETNLASYEEYLEDTVWCNDRSMNTQTNGWKENGSLTEYMFYKAYGRNTETYKPSVTCPNKNDAFTVSDTTKGNGKLKHPIALLTADELTMAGSGYSGYSSKSYLYTNQNWWSLSPRYFNDKDARGFLLHSSGTLNSNDGVVDNSVVGVRPAVSLAPGTSFTSGDGSSDTPYKVE